MAETLDIWKQYHLHPSQDLRNQIAIQYLPFVENIVRQVINTIPLSFDELKSAGVQALFRLIEQYNPESEIPFEGYANLRIRGAMIDEARKINQVDRSKAALIQKAHDAYSNPRFISLDAVSDEENQQNSKYDWYIDHNALSTEDQILKAEASHELKQALATLTQQEQIILSLYFVDERKMNEIADILDLSPSYISKLFQKAIKRLRLAHTRNRLNSKKKANK